MNKNKTKDRASHKGQPFRYLGILVKPASPPAWAPKIKWKIFDQRFMKWSKGFSSRRRARLYISDVLLLDKPWWRKPSRWFKLRILGGLNGHWMWTCVSCNGKVLGYGHGHNRRGDTIKSIHALVGSEKVRIELC